MMTYEILEKALALIEREENWCGYDWGDGSQRCAVHALEAAGGPIGSEAWNVLNETARRTFAQAASQFNDSHTHAEVVALFQKAIRAEKKKAGIPFDLTEPVVTSPEKAEVHA